MILKGPSFQSEIFKDAIWTKKNAPSIFRRAMDIDLRNFIGKFCHVYIDDIIVFSKSLLEHKNI